MCEPARACIRTTTYCNPDVPTQDCASMCLVVQAAAFGHAMIAQRYAKVSLSPRTSTYQSKGQGASAVSGSDLPSLRDPVRGRVSFVTGGAGCRHSDYGRSENAPYFHDAVPRAFLAQEQSELKDTLALPCLRSAIFLSKQT